MIKNLTVMNPELVEFEWRHLDNLELRQFDRMGFMAVPDSKAELQGFLDIGIVYSGVIGDKAIMLGGVCSPRPRIGFSWVLTSDLVKEYPVFFHKSCKRIIREGIEKYNLHRLETTIMQGHKVSIDWAERIGFVHECLMKKYDSDGNNYHLFARII